MIEALCVIATSPVAVVALRFIPRPAPREHVAGRIIVDGLERERQEWRHGHLTVARSARIMEQVREELAATARPAPALIGRPPADVLPQRRVMAVAA